MEEPLAVTYVQKLPLSDTSGGNRAIAPPEVFKRMFIVRYKQVATILPPDNISWLWLCAVMAGSLKQTFLANLRDAPFFEISFDEKTDLDNDFPLHWQALLIGYVRFPDKKSMKVVDHYAYLLYLPTGIAATAANILTKLADNFSQHGVTWLKCKLCP